MFLYFFQELDLPDAAISDLEMLVAVAAHTRHARKAVKAGTGKQEPAFAKTTQDGVAVPTVHDLLGLESHTEALRAQQPQQFDQLQRTALFAADIGLGEDALGPEDMLASDSQLDLNCPSYVLYGVKYIDLVSLAHCVGAGTHARTPPLSPGIRL